MTGCQPVDTLMAKGYAKPTICHISFAIFHFPLLTTASDDLESWRTKWKTANDIWQIPRFFFQVN